MGILAPLKAFILSVSPEVNTADDFTFSITSSHPKPFSDIYETTLTRRRKPAVLGRLLANNRSCEKNVQLPQHAAFWVCLEPMMVHKNNNNVLPHNFLMQNPFHVDV